MANAPAPATMGISTTRRWTWRHAWAIWRLPIGVQSLLGVVLGATIGWAFPAVGESLQLLGDVFLNGVQIVVIPLVFPLIVLGISRMESVKRVGRIAGKAILYFEIVTTLVLLLAIGLAKLFDIGVGAPVNGADAGAVEEMAQGIDFAELLLHAVPDNIVAAMAEGNLLAVIVFATVFGIALAAIGERARPVNEVLDSVATAMFRVVGYVIRLAPLGVLGFIAYDVAHYGFGNLFSLLGFVAVVYLGLILVVGVLFPIIAAIFGVKYFAMLRQTADLAGLAFVTRSSEAVLAPLLIRLEKFGVSRSTASFVVPLGYSFNTDGSVLYQAVALVFIANAYGLDTSIWSLLIMVGVLVVLSKGMAGVASASIVVLLAASSTIGLPAEGVALLLGVDFIVDMARTGVNVVGNSLAAAVIDRSEARATEKRAKASLPNPAAAADADTSADAPRVSPSSADEYIATGGRRDN
ncbi:dicarboxylate/amino acid:cation symporter [Microbacterium sp. B2969]|uniref:Dicarboxylate/amino acid:cation symporter n=1 Tax=Microbacterium alkaliflavum TaxID=3248839 RepID=A0ABW7QFR1_9MICO